MNSLIITEKKELFGPSQITRGKPRNVKSTPSLLFAKNTLPDSPGICNNRTKNSLRRLTKKQIYHQLLHLKTELEDYTRSDAFEDRLTFGYFLNQYIRRQNKLDKQFANDVGVTHAAISQYINDHRKPTKEFLVRLELHSNNLFPAIIWFKLIQKEKEYEIVTDSEIRTVESMRVKSRISSPGKNPRTQS